jgi:hypothetical protein
MADLGKLTIEMFPEPWIALNEEVGRHPELMKILGEQNQKDPYVMLADVSFYCGVALDATYTKQDIEDLCVALQKILYRKRTGITIIQ